jgi:hydrogenase maturation factor HypF (carbamoyltransferase family)
MKVELCGRCKGEGENEIRDRYDTEMFPCTQCGSTGRVIRRDYHYQVPFGTPKELIYETDKKICALIRDLERKALELAKNNEKG